MVGGRSPGFKRPEFGTDRLGMAASGATAGSQARGARLDDSRRGLVLLVDDEPLLLRSLRRILEHDGHSVLIAESPGAAEASLADPDLDVVLLDLFLGGTNGFELLERLKRDRPEVEVIVMTGHASIESAVRCMRRGAFDYLAKPFDDVHRVNTTVGRALERRRLVRRNRQLEDELRVRSPNPGLVGNSPSMRALGRTIHSLRHNESHVLIQGESGTGKEIVARSLHTTSPRAQGDFVPVDCGALPETIIESELFGHEKGAFTGAVGAPGLFRMADRGTLFLDEIGEIQPSVQAKLLRALQQKEVRPVGASTTVAVDIRVISATHRDLSSMVGEGRFRADLFYRLNVVRIEIPPLREHREDIPLLVHHFLHKHGSNTTVDGIDDEALELLVDCDWPGNVRELENAVESAMALASGPRLRASDLRVARTGPRPPPWPGLDGIPLSLEAYERAAVERAMSEAGGDAEAAAKRLGIGRSTLYRKLAKYSLGRGGGPVRMIR